MAMRRILTEYPSTSSTVIGASLELSTYTTQRRGVASGTCIRFHSTVAETKRACDALSLVPAHFARRRDEDGGHPGGSQLLECSPS